jgi:predicted DNA-binding transcriptional regulator AlpA
MFKVIPPAERIGLDRIEAAEYVGVGTTLFDQMVADGRMPKPKVINSRRIWYRPELEKAFAQLPTDAQSENASDPFAARNVA